LKVALPLDPGPHHIVVTAPGHTPRSYDVVLAAGEVRRLAVAAGPLEAPPMPPPVLATPAPLPRAKRTGGVVLLASGAALLGAGAYFGLRALQARNQAHGDCARGESTMGPPLCWDRAYKALSHDTTYSRLADVAFVAGGVATAVGAYLVLRPAAPAEGRAPLALALQPAANGGEVSLAGRF
jgi:hypothetical protein